MSLKVHYDPEVDVLYLAREGQEEEVVEVYPGLNLELDASGELIGVELLHASELLKEAIGPLMQKATSGQGGKGMVTPDIDPNHFKRFCKGLGGQTLKTLKQGCAFKFSVISHPAYRLLFTPESTGKEGGVAERYLDIYIREYNSNGGSLRPSDYTGAVNGSYVTTLFSLYWDHLKGRRCYTKT
ncbi:MAG: DUF2283 domain-containing protein [Dehalococcoidia bacterium]|nr:DUF2283 domain-containing protein [Dehalococcoidia bacterium]